jgi:thiamine pyrophosphokinase
LGVKYIPVPSGLFKGEKIFQNMFLLKNFTHRGKKYEVKNFPFPVAKPF